MQTLRELGEDAVVRRLTDGLVLDESVLVGPGDDCAVVDDGDAENYQLLKTDCIVENVHYKTEECPKRVGWKAVARVISDFAAMGGVPKSLLVTIAVSPNREISYLEDLYGGMQNCAGRYGANICGGETSSVPEGSSEMIVVSGTGSVLKRQLVTRAGGRPGDRLLVTGLLGGSIAGKHLDFIPRVEEAGWLGANYEITAMMDLSDGIARDLPRLCAASGCGANIFHDDIPKTEGCELTQALGDGEDYELMFSIGPLEIDDLLEKWSERFTGVPLSVIGELCDVANGDVVSEGGWDHFSDAVSKYE